MTAASHERDELWACLTGMYDAYMAGQPEAVDTFLDPAATIFDSARPDLIRGKAELDEVRRARPAPGEGPVEESVEAVRPVIDVFGELALVRYWLIVTFRPDSQGRSLVPETVRNTAVLIRASGRWRILHLHEDVVQTGGHAG
ncbi:nuclear transport factor 2 family protein [Streptomyces sp. R-07]|uniref:nuclear transport factor 2 family protein n=1 Tax=Streptomyces sp. R-07 TaxID=3404052 RepID=UPI003CF97465